MISDFGFMIDDFRIMIKKALEGSGAFFVLVSGVAPFTLIGFGGNFWGDLAFSLPKQIGMCTF